MVKMVLIYHFHSALIQYFKALALTDIMLCTLATYLKVLAFSKLVQTVFSALFKHSAAAFSSSQAHQLASADYFSMNVIE
jgi:predicted transcriptional regulator